MSRVDLIAFGKSCPASEPWLAEIHRHGWQVESVAGQEGRWQESPSWVSGLIYLAGSGFAEEHVGFVRRLTEEFGAMPRIVVAPSATADEVAQLMYAGATSVLRGAPDADGLTKTLDPCVRRRAAMREMRHELCASSESMGSVVSDLLREIAGRSNLVIEGPTGSGKEAVARLLHAKGPRASSPFLPIAAASLTDQLADSELFGHARGAFTDAATAHAGLLETAGEGTVFLDEVADLTPGVQAKLLRVLQEREFRPVGGKTARPLRARVICSSNRDLKAEVAAGRVREDLYFRIAVSSLRLPALSERRSDIPVLARRILDHYLLGNANAVATSFAPDALCMLSFASWPGNIRQLAATVEHLAALASNRQITPEDVKVLLGKSVPDRVTLDTLMARSDRDYLVELMRRTSGSVTDAAREAGRSRTSFYRLLRACDLPQVSMVDRARAHG